MKKNIFILLALIPLVMGCKEITLSMNDSGKTVTAVAGTILKVSLVSNRSTGNSWHNIRYDKSVIMQVGDPIYEKSKTNLVGAPGKAIYTFKILKTGVTYLKIDYGAAYSKNSDPVKTFDVKIVVK